MKENKCWKAKRKSSQLAERQKHVLSHRNSLENSVPFQSSSNKVFKKRLSMVPSSKISNKVSVLYKQANILIRKLNKKTEVLSVKSLNLVSKLEKSSKNFSLEQKEIENVRLHISNLKKTEKLIKLHSEVKSLYEKITETNYKFLSNELYKQEKILNEKNTELEQILYEKETIQNEIIKQKENKKQVSEIKHSLKKQDDKLKCSLELLLEKIESLESKVFENDSIIYGRSNLYENEAYYQMENFSENLEILENFVNSSIAKRAVIGQIKTRIHLKFEKNQTTKEFLENFSTEIKLKTEKIQNLLKILEPSHS